jgi:hypothetical protein
MVTQYVWYSRQFNGDTICRVIKIIQAQFSSAKFNSRAETTAVWPTKGRTRNDQNINTVHENIQ